METASTKSNASKSELELLLLKELQRFTWFTTYQRRDMLITEMINTLKCLGIEEQARRKSLPDEFVECPRCRGYHTEKDNENKFCEKCEQIVHVAEWDHQHATRP